MRACLDGEVRIVDLAGGSGFRTQCSIGLKSTGRWLRALSRGTAVQRYKDYVIVKLRKRVEELECDNKLYPHALFSQGHARGAGFSKSVGARFGSIRKACGILARVQIRLLRFEMGESSA